MKLILLAILAVVLAANNPSENDFEQYVGDKIAKNEIAKKLLSQEGGILKSIIEALDGVPCLMEQPFAQKNMRITLCSVSTQSTYSVSRDLRSHYWACQVKSSPSSR